mmetsp:Transcript_74434/g.146103  ORF Transcript_74434/g.146103 Transcript_74434/m.146103 type:complete len:239 (+) Transcript_74434:248-964(+)
MAALSARMPAKCLRGAHVQHGTVPLGRQPCRKLPGELDRNLAGLPIKPAARLLPAVEPRAGVLEGVVGGGPGRARRRRARAVAVAIPDQLVVPEHLDSHGLHALLREEILAPTCVGEILPAAVEPLHEAGKRCLGHDLDTAIETVVDIGAIVQVDHVIGGQAEVHQVLLDSPGEGHGVGVQLHHKIEALELPTFLQARPCPKEVVRVDPRARAQRAGAAKIGRQGADALRVESPLQGE